MKAGHITQESEDYRVQMSLKMARGHFYCLAVGILQDLFGRVYLAGRH